MGDFPLNEDAELPRFFRRWLLSLVPYIEVQFWWAAEYRDLIGPAAQARNLSTVIHGQKFSPGYPSFDDQKFFLWLV